MRASGAGPCTKMGDYTTPLATSSQVVESPAVRHCPRLAQSRGGIPVCASRYGVQVVFHMDGFIAVAATALAWPSKYAQLYISLWRGTMIQLALP